MPHIIDLGIQNAVTSHGSHEGLPALFLLPIAHDGEMGTIVPTSDNEALEQKIQEEGTIIRFHNGSALLRFLERLALLADTIAEHIENQEKGPIT